MDMSVLWITDALGNIIIKKGYDTDKLFISDVKFNDAGDKILTVLSIAPEEGLSRRRLSRAR